MSLIWKQSGNRVINIRSQLSRKNNKRSRWHPKDADKNYGSKAGSPKDSNAAVSKKQILDKAKILTEINEQITSLKKRNSPGLISRNNLKNDRF